MVNEEERKTKPFILELEVRKKETGNEKQSLSSHKLVVLYRTMRIKLSGVG